MNFQTASQRRTGLDFPLSFLRFVEEHGEALPVHLQLDIGYRIGHQYGKAFGRAQACNTNRHVGYSVS